MRFRFWGMPIALLGTLVARAELRVQHVTPKSTPTAAKGTPAPKKPTAQKGVEPTGFAKTFFELLNLPDEKNPKVPLPDRQLVNARKCMGPVAFKVIYKDAKNSPADDRVYYRMVGPMSRGYLYGSLLSYAKTYCAVTHEGKKGPYYDMVTKVPTDPDDTLSIMPPAPGVSPLIQNHAILLSLGGIESGGAFNEGRDASSWNIDAYSAEAGTYQASYDTHRAARSKKEVRDERARKAKEQKKPLGDVVVAPDVINHVNDEDYKFMMAQFKHANKDPLCMNAIFELEQGMSKNFVSWGYGPGYDYQEAVKNCPALANFYQAYLQRKSARVNGPTIRRQAQPKQACIEVLQAVTSILNPESCQKLDHFIQNFTTFNGAHFNFRESQEPIVELKSGPQPWVQPVRGQKAPENPGWNYSPQYISSYTLPLPGAIDQEEDDEDAPRESRPVPEYSEISAIRTTIRYYKSTGRLAEVEALENRIKHYQSNPAILKRALEKKEVDIQKANIVLARARRAANADDVYDAKQKPLAIAARAKALTVLEKMYENLKGEQAEIQRLYAAATAPK